VRASRYSSEPRPLAVLQHQGPRPAPAVSRLRQVAEETRLVASEPLGDLAGAWNEVPESSYGIVQEGQDELLPFTPRMPVAQVAMA